MKYPMKLFKYINKKLFILIIIIIFLLACYLVINYTDILGKILFPIHRYEKSSFTDKEINLISDTINIQCNKIEKMNYTTARDSVFLIYISDFEEQDLNKNYNKTSSLNYDILYEDKDPNTIRGTICYFEEYNEQDVLVVSVRDYNDILRKIVKKNSIHTIY